MRGGLLVILFCGSVSSCLAAPELLDDQFELPRGFHIYWAAGPELSGGSYDITFDGEGRLLVGDGTGVRRLKDTDGDGVFNSFETIATGLGPRGPQGLLVYDDRLYAVGGDGIQLFGDFRAHAHNGEQLACALRARSVSFPHLAGWREVGMHRFRRTQPAQPGHELPG